jgi:hypothetical protein
LTPYLFKERSVRGPRKTKRDADGVRQVHFLSVDWKTLGLLAVGNPQLVSGCARIPEVPAKEKALYLVVLQDREEGCILHLYQTHDLCPVNLCLTGRRRWYLVVIADSSHAFPCSVRRAKRFSHFARQPGC